MQNVILVVHILACLIVTGLVLIQKSEGGGLGIGGGGGGGAGSLMSGRGAAGALVRSTIMFAGIFFVTSLALTTLANRNTDTRTNVERALGADEDGATGPVDLLDPTAPLSRLILCRKPSRKQVIPSNCAAQVFSLRPICPNHGIRVIP
jgi:preprotein translocase subunit SecG